MKINEILKTERERKGLSLKQLSEEIEIPIYILERLENDENYSQNDPYGKLYAKKVLKSFNIEIRPKEDKQETERKLPSNQSMIYLKALNTIVKVIPHSVAIAVFVFFIYANANLFNKNTDIQVKNIQQNSSMDLSIQNQVETQKIINHITLVSEGDVWITINVDGEKNIVNLKEGESKTIYFNNKITFETIGNVNKLKIIYDDKEVKISDREIIHNVFVDSEGIFYNGYNILRGIPKI